MSIVMVIESITLVSYILFLVMYFKGGSAVVHDMKSAIETTRSYKSTVLMVVMACLVGVLLLFSILTMTRYLPAIKTTDNMVLKYVGMGIVLFCIFSLFRCRFVFLKELWRSNVEIDPGQPVVDRGPYRYIRHPLYAYSFYMYIGYGLVYSSLPVWGISLLLIVSYLILTQYEDSMLSRQVENYTGYIEKVPHKLIRGIW